MIEKQLSEKWFQRKELFKNEVLRLLESKEFVFTYKDLLVLVIKEIINPGLDPNDEYLWNLEGHLNSIDVNRISECSLGEWNGEYIYLMPPLSDHLGVDGCWVAKVYFGSCSGVDELLRAEEVEDINVQIDIIMNLSLNLLESFRPLTRLYNNVI